MSLDARPATPSPAPEAPGDGPRTGRAGNAGRLLVRLGRDSSVNLGVGVMLVLLVAYLWITEEHFATYDNLITILETNAILLIVAIGLTYVMLVGGFDLSLGGMLALSGIILVDLLGAMPAGLAIALTVVIATTLGLVLNGVLIAKVGLSFLVVTLGTASLFRGVALVQTEGRVESVFDEQLLVTLGSEEALRVPWSVWIALAVLAISILVLRYTGFGRMLYAVGGNREAARLAGIPTTLVRLSVYGIAAGLAGFAGALEVGRLSSASPTAGTGIELVAAAAVLLGGTTFMGGRGTMVGTLLGVLFLGVLNNGITLAGIQAFWQSIVAGIVVIVALLLDRATRRRGEM